MTTQPEFHDRMLSLGLARVSEAAALASAKLVGRGDEKAADQAAVDAMRNQLNLLDIKGCVVIGEGERDEAPMLYIGEQVGKGGEPVDIAVDPIEGTRMTALGQSNAVAVLAAGERGCFLKAPDMYMEKLVVGPQARGLIDLDQPLEDNVRAVARALDKPLQELVVVTLEKPRHRPVIELLQSLGVKVFALPDGDVAASILTSVPESEVDLMYCIGGAPEGIISAAVTRALGGDMQGRLLLRHDAKEDTPENRIAGEGEAVRCRSMGIEPGVRLRLEDMVRSDNLVFSATGITKGDLLQGVTRQGTLATTETLLIRGRSRTVRRIQSTHYLERKDDALKSVIL